MQEEGAKRRFWRPIWRALVEICFIIFLFYSNLLMGEYTRGNAGTKTLSFALRDIATGKTFGIALGTAILGFFFFQYLRKQL